MEVGGNDCVVGVDMGFLVVVKDDWRGESDRSGGCSSDTGGLQGDWVVMMLLVVFSRPLLCPLLVRRTLSLPFFFGFGSKETVFCVRPKNDSCISLRTYILARGEIRRVVDLGLVGGELCVVVNCFAVRE